MSPQTFNLPAVNYAGPSQALQPSPFDNPQNWDSIEVAGVLWGPAATPGAGHIVVRRAKRSYKWEKKIPKGQVGERQTWVGRHFPPFELVFHFWDTNGYNAWQQFSSLFIYADETAPPALSIYHPALNLVGISSVIVVEVGAPELMNEGGEYTAVVTLEEFKPVTAKNITSSPAGASNTIGEVSIKGFALPPARAALLSQIALEQARVAGANGGIPDPSLGWIPSQGGFP